ncbi:hypothetical protein AVEN_238685-1 [Araneus ventricosus]|uniref:Uncharacterized protein n=1 Tax=Araneus ventricosus TaxID=182803 RepID=A0A4Y2BVN8_ARAVE|nr:hypothetical protein AVEN_238685-1 [Araneus ventricosus]
MDDNLVSNLKFGIHPSSPSRSLQEVIKIFYSPSSPEVLLRFCIKCHLDVNTRSPLLFESGISCKGEPIKKCPGVNALTSLRSDDNGVKGLESRFTWQSNVDSSSKLRTATLQARSK